MGELRGIGGWLLVFLILTAAVSVFLVILLILLLSHGTLSREESMAGILGVALAVVGNAAAILWLGLEKPRGVPLAQRGLILTLITCIHIALLEHLANTPFLEIMLLVVGFVLAWSIYFGFSAYIHRRHFQVDVSRRISATYPADKRPLPLVVRAVYSTVIVAYAVYVGVFIWRVIALSAA